MKVLKLKKRKSGFTIIEVVLVLAIAGLIFLMVFLALPALQRSQRDALRKRQAAMYIEAFNRAKVNRVTFPGNEAKIDKLVRLGCLKNEEMLDPSTGEIYKLDNNATLNSLFKNYDKIPIGFYGISDYAECRDNIPVSKTGRGGARVIIIPLENGGWICADTQN